MLIENITAIEINKIFDNKERKIKYLMGVYQHLGIEAPIPRTLNSINNAIINTWNYESSKRIIREMFFKASKYRNGIACRERINYLVTDWYNMELGDIEWPFSAMNFDSYVARLNRDIRFNEDEKDEMIASDAIRFRRIKDINTCRNDYIESLIVKYNENVIPTFKHSRGVDFYIDGIPFDQKVSKSVGKSFIDEYGDNYRQIAIDNPDLVAKSLYENQDEERFDAEQRLYIVYLDNDISSESIEQSIIDNTFDISFNIDFQYLHSGRQLIDYNTDCFVVLLHN